MTLCKAIQRHSRWVWNKLKLAHQELELPLGEESITDFLLLGLKKDLGRHGFEITSFTRHEECKNGADWELCLIGPKGTCLLLRIQAKVVSRDGRFERLHYRNDAGESQTQKLIDNSMLHHATPLYMLYTFWCHAEPGLIWPSGLCYRKDKRLFGISIVPADTVLGLKPKTKIDDVIPSAFPFCELFCCKKGSDIAEMTSTKLSVLLKQEIKTTDKLPPHIVRLLKGDGEPQLPEGLGRVSIIKQTEQDTCK